MTDQYIKNKVLELEKRVGVLEQERFDKTSKEQIGNYLEAKRYVNVITADDIDKYADEPCDTISKEAVLKRIAQFSVEEGSSVRCQPLYSDVNNMPSVKPVRYIAHWINIEPNVCKCSRCNARTFTGGFRLPIYCGNCGAEMERVE